MLSLFYTVKRVCKILRGWNHQLQRCVRSIKVASRDPVVSSAIHFSEVNEISVITLCNSKSFSWVLWYLFDRALYTKSEITAYDCYWEVLSCSAPVPCSKRLEITTGTYMHIAYDWVHVSFTPCCTNVWHVTHKYKQWTAASFLRVILLHQTGVNQQQQDSTLDFFTHKSFVTSRHWVAMTLTP